MNTPRHHRRRVRRRGRVLALAEAVAAARVIPVSQELPGYRPHTARRDGIAALTVAALALPSAMAYAEVAGVFPVNGLYALLLPTVAYALLGTSRQLVIGPGGLDLSARRRVAHRLGRRLGSHASCRRSRTIGAGPLSRGRPGSCSR